MGALESQLEEAARQLGAEIVQEQSSMPAADVIEVNTQSEPEQPVAEEPKPRTASTRIQFSASSR
jgi:hypothetical protein